MDGNQLDVKVKTAKYIEKNNSICQEFYFAHPQTKVKVNNIYNGHWTGSQLWRFGCKQLDKLEATYNRSVKIMYDLPLATHRYFIETLTGLPHVRRILVKRYLKFINMIRNSTKTAIIQLLDLVSTDVRLTTGNNLRSIMIQTGRNRIEELEAGSVDIKYLEVIESEAWRIDFLKEVVELRNGDLEVTGFSKEELEEIKEYLCTE